MAASSVDDDDDDDDEEWRVGILDSVGARTNAAARQCPRHTAANRVKNSARRLGVAIVGLFFLFIPGSQRDKRSPCDKKKKWSLLFARKRSRRRQRFASRELTHLMV